MAISAKERRSAHNAMSNAEAGANAPKRRSKRSALAKPAKADPQVVSVLSRPDLTIAQAIQTVLTSYGDHPALAWRKKSGAKLAKTFTSITYDELWAQVKSLASAFKLDPDFALEPGDMVATLGFAGPRYVAIALAVQFNGLPYVPLQPSLGQSQLLGIIREVRAKCLATSAEHLAAALANALACDSVKTVLVFDFDAADSTHVAALDAARHAIANAGSSLKLITFEQACERGALLPDVSPFEPAKGHNPLNTIIYTSGSTGSPKGAMYNESNAVVAWAAAAFGEPQIVLHYQPLSHSYGSSIIFMALARGGVVCFTARSDLSTLLEDVALVRPTDIGFVPRVCELIYQRACAEQPGAELDYVGLRKTLLGGRMRTAVTASAPLAPELRDFMEKLLGFALLDSYGSTETHSIAVNGVIQKPPVIDYKLVSVPELGYFTTDTPHPRGELIVKTKRLMAGYYARPELNAKLVDEDGFYHTGDIMAEVAPGQIRYLERRNNVLKLAQGEFVAISKLEALYAGGDPAIRQVFLYGNSNRAYLLAVVVPNFDVIPQDLSDAETKLRLMGAFRTIVAAHNLNSYEAPRALIIEREAFSTENGLLAGVGKYMRPAFYAKYQARLETLYADMARGQDEALRELRAAGAQASVTEGVLRAAQITLGVDEIPSGGDVSFDAIGGDSLSALSFALLLEDVFKTPVEVGDILHPTDTLLDLARKIEAARAYTGAARATFKLVHGEDPAVISASDLTLDKFIDPEVLSKAANLAPPVSGAAKTVLLTGANGFLGRFIALEWLERLAKTGGTLVCIGRGENDASARARLRAAFEGDAALEALFDQLGAAHLEVLAGDLTAPRLGLSEARWDDLAARVDVIAHPAALVNHKLPYRQLFQPNVVGTAELIALALTTRMKRLVYISTVAAAYNEKGEAISEGVDVRDAIPRFGASDGYAIGYATSKWAGEVLLREAHARFGLPVNVFRSNMILAHRIYRGQLNVPDVFTRFALSLAQTRIAPPSFYTGDRERAHYEGLPVDFVARASVAIGEHYREGYHTFHVVNPHDDGVSMDSFVDWMRDAGEPVQRLDDYADWRARFETALRALPEKIKAASSLPVIDMFDRPSPAVAEAQMPAERFVAAVAEAMPDSGGIPHLDRALIEKYLSDIEGAGLLQRGG